MKTLNLLILFTFLTHGIHGQSENDVLKEIRKNYRLIYSDLLPQSSQVKLGYQIGIGELHLIKDDFTNSSFDCASDVCHNFYTLYFIRNKDDGKWELIKCNHQSGFADGPDSWRIETNYYFKDQNLFFVYSLTVNNYDDGNQDDDYEITRTENRFYYSQGKIIKHLFKQKNTRSDSGSETQAKSSLKESIKQIPSKENTHINTKKFDATWINNLIEVWGHGAKKIEW